MISGPEFLFPAQIPVPSSPEYLKMIAEIGKGNRISRWFFFAVGVLLLTPVVLLGSVGLWQLIRAGSMEPEHSRGRRSLQPGRARRRGPGERCGLRGSGSLREAASVVPGPPEEDVMISRIEFLFPAQAPNLASPEYLRMIREIGD
jgi:hypothetical protein